jgi:uncharacterized YigZ family protein
MKMITNEIEIKKSRFITYLYNLDDESKVNEIVESIRKEHKKARHVVYVYKINNTAKINDDGEPKGTAGMPIFNVIEKNNLNNILIIVVRYFGGIKLGAGGLFRAYSNSASEIIKKQLNN